mmetsp:Transcript_5637/g.8903  ORF Transcript_5637/g.8903 Transcript_5637/m.8903 type:complete len:162 (-) Transcript_5637:883-1368(-)
MSKVEPTKNRSQSFARDTLHEGGEVMATGGDQPKVPALSLESGENSTIEPTLDGSRECELTEDDGVEQIDIRLGRPRTSSGSSTEALHPLFSEYDRLLEELKKLGTVQTLAHSVAFLDAHLGIVGKQQSYRLKIKGFHLPFNTKEPLRAPGAKGLKGRGAP